MAGKCITSFKLIITNCCSMIVLILFCPTVYTKGFIPTETATTKSINNQSMSHSNRFLSCSTENVNLFYLKGKCINCDNFNYSDKKLSFLNYSTYENCNSLQHEYLDLLSDEDGFILLYNYIILHDCKMQIALPFNNYSSRLAFILVDNRDNNIADASKVFEAVMDNFQSKIGKYIFYLSNVYIYALFLFRLLLVELSVFDGQRFLYRIIHNGYKF